MPILKTVRLMLAPPLLHEQMNVKHYLRWLNNDAIMQFSEQRHYTHDEKSQYEYLCSFKDTPHYMWDIHRNNIPIGTATAYCDTINKTANVGVLIGESKYWGQGYASEAWEAVCDFLFENGIRKIEAGCMASNSAMRRVLEKNEFALEATIPQHFLRQGKPEDALYYGKYREAKVIQIKREEVASSS